MEVARQQKVHPKGPMQRIMFQHTDGFLSLLLILVELMPFGVLN